MCRIAVKPAASGEAPLLFSRDGQVLAIKAADGSVRLVEMPMGRELRRLTIKDQPNWLQMPCSFSHDGKYFIAGPMVWGIP